jgi:integrase
MERPVDARLETLAKEELQFPPQGAKAKLDALRQMLLQVERSFLSNLVVGRSGGPVKPRSTAQELVVLADDRQPSLRVDRSELLEEDERALWSTAFYAGLRRGELQALQWADVDLPKRVIHVSRSWDAVAGEQAPKSAAGVRRVPVIDTLVRELAAHKLRSGRDGADLVFGRTSTRPFPPESLRRRSLAAWEAENERRTSEADDGEPVELLVPIMLHEARHTCASWLIAANANALTVKAIMGHESITMTFDTYGHLMPGGLDEAREAGDAFLARTGS